MELLNESKWVILKLLGGFLVVSYLLLTGIHMSNGLRIERALSGANIDARVALSCPTNTRRIWEVINRSREGDDILKSDRRYGGKNYSDLCG